MGSSRTMDPSLLKGFWCSSSSHVLILWVPGDGGGDFGSGCYLRSKIFSFVCFGCLTCSFVLLSLKKLSILLERR